MKNYVDRIATQNKPAFILQYLINVLDYTGTIFNQDILELILSYLPETVKNKLVDNAFAYCTKTKLDVSMVKECFLDGTNSVNETLIELFEKSPVRRKFKKTIIHSLKQIQPENKHDRNILEQRIEEIQPIFGLSELESRILILYYLEETDTFMSRLIDSLADYLGIQTSRFYGELNETTVAILLGERRSVVHRALTSKSSLVKTGMLNKERDISEEIVQYLEGFKDKPILQNYFTEYTGKTIPLKDHFVKQADITLIKKLYKQRSEENGVNVLLYGPPGTGKTEFARSLAAHLRASLYEIKSVRENENKEDTNNFRIRAFTACQNMVDTSQALIVVDEADSLLNAIPQFFLFKQTTEKGLINSLLDESRSFNIWITNYVDGMDESTRRRFDYAVKFERMSYAQRCKLWQYKAHQYQLNRILEPKDLEELAETYESNAGEIEVAMRNAAGINTTKMDKEALRYTIENIINSQMALKGNPENRYHKKQREPVNYNLAALNLNTDVSAVISSLEKFNSVLDKPESSTSIMNMNLFLYGPPGTGKTEFARYLARHLKRKLIVKSAADILSH